MTLQFVNVRARISVKPASVQISSWSIHTMLTAKMRIQNENSKILFFFLKVESNVVFNRQDLAK
jgi:hypothetical protein